MMHRRRLYDKYLEYESPAEGLMPLWAMGDEIRGMQDCPLKGKLVGILEDVERHRREAVE